jgi:hypothetical protein
VKVVELVPLPGDAVPLQIRVFVDPVHVAAATGVVRPTTLANARLRATNTRLSCDFTARRVF